MIITRWAMSAGLLVAIGPVCFAQPSTTPANTSVPVQWKRVGTLSPDTVVTPPQAAPVVVAASAEQNTSPSKELVRGAESPPNRLQKPVTKPVTRPILAHPAPKVLPRLPRVYQKQAQSTDPEETGVNKTTQPVIRVRGVAPDEEPSPTPVRLPGQLTGVIQEAAPSTPQQPIAPVTPPVPGVSDPAQPLIPGVPTNPPAGSTAPKTFHGLKYPVQPLAPPGGAPVTPRDPGYYSLLDLIHNDESETAPRWPYPRFGIFPNSYAEMNFSYLDSIPFDDRDWAEKLKRIPVGDHWLFSTGGEVRYRYNMEQNTRLTGVNDTYNLIRTRLNTDLWYENNFRLFTEFYYGDTAGQDYTPYPRDVNRGDIQQLFVDLKVWELSDGNPIYVRGGRQEMTYGSQRLISPSDFGDNRLRFDGVKGFYRSDTIDADVFAVRPVLVSANSLDTWDVHQTFSGTWFTYKPKAGTFIDLYYLNLDNVNTNVAKGEYRSGGYNISTFGSRYYSRFDNGFLLDVEGMLQTGHWADQSVLGQALSAYAGWYFKDVWAKPTFWIGYDYASGDPDPNNTGQHKTFNQLFQFGHYYYGFADITGGQNIRDYNIQAYAYPTNWITTGLQYHIFRLDSDKDALYNASGVAIRQDKTGKAGDDVGSELDLIANFHLTNRQDIFFNYCHFFTGSFIKATSSGNAGVALDYVYLQYSMRW